MTREAVNVGELPFHADELEELLASGNLDVAMVDAEGRTSLHRAIDVGAEAAVRLLVDAGADVNLADRWGNTPLWRAVYQVSDAEAIVDLLLKHGADPP